MVDIANLEQVQDATVYYDYANTIGQGLTASMFRQQGIGDYSTVIDVGNEAGTYFNSQPGNIDLNISIKDKNNSMFWSNIHSVDVFPCQSSGGVVSNNPPQGQDPSPGGVVSNNPPQGGIVPEILWFSTMNQAFANSTLKLDWATDNTNCGVYLGNEKVSASGTKEYYISSSEAGKTLKYKLEARGGDCNNPYVVEKIIEVPVTYAVANCHMELGAGWGVGTDLEAGGTAWDLALVEPSPGAYSFSMNTTAKISPYGNGEPGSIAQCSASGNTAAVNSASYFCFWTTSGNPGYFYVSQSYYDLDRSTYIVEISVNIELRY